ncbi:MAG: glycosyltransferase [Gelidibacter sp.]
MIPKIIHYCWLSGEEFPQDVKNNLASWREILPDYDFVLWDSERSEVVKCLWTEEALKNKKYAFASDLIRLYAVHTYGGIYLDCDVEVLKSFDNLLHLPYFIGFERNSFIEAAIFGSEKNALWISNIMEHYKNRAFVKEDGSFDIALLPVIMKAQIELTRQFKIMDTNEAQDATLLENNESLFWLFPFDYFSPKDIETGKISATTNTYTIHHFASSWLPLPSKIRRKIMRIIGLGRTEKIISYFKLREMLTFIKCYGIKKRKKLF